MLVPPSGACETEAVVDYALNKEGREPRDACDVLIPILRGKCGRVDAAHRRQRPRNVA